MYPAFKLSALAALAVLCLAVAATTATAGFSQNCPLIPTSYFGKILGPHYTVQGPDAAYKSRNIQCAARNNSGTISVAAWCHMGSAANTIFHLFVKGQGESHATTKQVPNLGDLAYLVIVPTGGKTGGFSAIYIKKGHDIYNVIGKLGNASARYEAAQRPMPETKLLVLAPRLARFRCP